MTSNDPWAAAQAAVQNSAPATPAGDGGQIMPQGGGLGGGALFGSGKSIPSLFNKTHGAGTVRGGVIKDVRDVHARNHPREGGQLKYWPNGQTGKGVKPVTDANSPDGKPNRPVMDTHVILDTEYRMDAAEASAVGREPSFMQEDDGTRTFVVQDLRGMQNAIGEFNKGAPAGQQIVNPESLIGKRLDVKRLAAPMEPQRWEHRISA